VAEAKDDFTPPGAPSATLQKVKNNQKYFKKNKHE